MDYKAIEEVIKDTLLSYEQGWNEANAPEKKIKFHLTVSKHVTKIKGKNQEVAYLRLERETYLLKTSEQGWEEGDDDKNEKLEEAYVIYHTAYKFKNKAEIMEPDKWRKYLYFNLFTALIGGGIEHAEFMNRVRKVNHREERTKEVLQTKEDTIQVAKEMPKPLTKDEQEYKEWVKKNNEHAVKK